MGKEKQKTKGKPDSVDVHVGKRLRIRRSLLGLSQEKLAEAIRVATSDANIRNDAAAVGQAIQAEHGVKEAVAIVSRYLAQRPRFFDGLI